MIEKESISRSESPLAKKPLETLSNSDEESAHREKIIETNRRWGRLVTAAENKAINESSARDLAGWAKRKRLDQEAI